MFCPLLRGVYTTGNQSTPTCVQQFHVLCIRKWTCALPGLLEAQAMHAGWLSYIRLGVSLNGACEGYNALETMAWILLVCMPVRQLRWQGVCAVPVTSGEA